MYSETKRNDVGVMIDEQMKSKVVNIARKSDKMITVKLIFK